MLADADERVTINRRASEITISFGGDTNQAAQFARSVPDFVLKGRFADLVKLDLQALEHFAGAGNHSDQTGPRAVRYAVANSAAPSIRRRQTRRTAGFEPSVPLAKDPVRDPGQDPIIDQGDRL
jgi:hypothetical protein